MSSYSVALEQQVALLRHLQARGTDRMWWEALERADPFFVAGRLEPLLHAGEESPSLVLTEGIVPAEAGFAWFEDGPFVALIGSPTPEIRPERPVPKPLAEVDPLAGQCRAIVWGSALFGERGATGPRLPGIEALLVVSTPERRAGQPLVQVSWLYGIDTETAVARNRERDTSGIDPDGRLARFVLRRLSALFAFCGQRLLSTREERTDRGSRRRLQQQGWARDPLVRVVRLRRTEPRTPTPGEGADSPDWSCRWVVRGHWRQHWFPSKRQRQPIWIAPHVKGPENRPLKAPRATVFAVVR
jgi:hypothetical protein